MKKNSEPLLRRLVCYGLSLALSLSPLVSVYATEEMPEEQAAGSSTVTETTMQESQQTEQVLSPESVSSVSAEDEAVSSTAGEEIEEINEGQEQDPDSEAETVSTADMQDLPEVQTISTPAAADSISDPETHDSAELQLSSSPETVSETEDDTDKEVPAPAAAVVSAETRTALKSAGSTASKGTSGTSITIGDTSFQSEDEESSHWSDGKGWKNISGQYVAMVDYDGSNDAISADSGVLTLAVAGVNRIGTLKGNCSYQIAGTGIVLIDSIELEDGNSLTLHPNSALYAEGSAAVFLKQDDGSYLLINGDVTGMLDEVYSLDNVRLVIPKGSSLSIGALGIRTETWAPEDSEEPVNDITLYTEDLPYNAYKPVHDGGYVEIEGLAGSVTLGKNSTITIEDGASVLLKKVRLGLSYAEAELIVQGALNVIGVLEGGFIDICDGGSVAGEGTIKSAEINLNANGTISKDLLLDTSGLTINGDGSITSPEIKDSTIYLKGKYITIPDLKVSGSSYIGVETEEIGHISNDNRSIGNIILSPGSSLGIVCNEHAADNFTRLPRYLEDSYLTITGKITGGTVNVLGGLVTYTGKDTDVLPVVPFGYASRVYITEADMLSTLNPVNMTAEEAARLAKTDQIPVSRLSVYDSLVSENVLAREWLTIIDLSEFEPLERRDEQFFTCAEFLNAYGLEGNNNSSVGYTAVEVIYSNLDRALYYMDDPGSFSTYNVIMIRVLDCSGRGGQGGSAVTHTSSSITGCGVIGGPGAGSVTAGSGTVIFSAAKQSSVDPVSDDQDGEENKSNLNNDNNDSNNNNGGSTGTETENGSGAFRAVSATVSSANNADDLVVTISLLELPERYVPESDPDTPQIYQLNVTAGGIAVADLKENSVKAVFPFNIPEDWGDPADVAAYSLYAVFADENGVLNAYEAQYDPDTGEVSFETDQTGKFIIIRFDYEEELFTDEFYDALAESKEVRAFMDIIRDLSSDL